MPPQNFGMMEDDLYRSAQPHEQNYPFLEKLKLRTVVWLAPEEPSKRLYEYINQSFIYGRPRNRL